MPALTSPSALQSKAGTVPFTAKPKKGMSVNIFEMSGYALDEENSFESPERVISEQRMIAVEGSSFNYDFPKHSVTVFRVKGQ